MATTVPTPHLPAAQAGVDEHGLQSPWAGDVFPRGDAVGPIVRQVETVCPYCGVGCALVLNLDREGRIAQVDDVPASHSSRGMLCVKGRFGLGFVHSPERLVHPLIRRVKGGEFEQATWDEALDLIADKMVEHRGKVGLVGSAKSTNEDCYVVQKFARVALGTNNVDHCARLCHSSSMVAMMDMLGSGTTSNSYDDFEIAGALLIVGSDANSNHPVIAARIRNGVVNHGTKLIIVDPRYTPFCDIAEYWLRPNPGTDVALFNGLARVALDEGLWDEAFVRDRTEGFDAWRASLAEWDAGTVSRITGVPVDDLRGAARLYARPAEGRASSILWGMGITQHTHGVANVHTLLNLGLATGNVGKPGSGFAPLRGQNNVQGSCDVGMLPDYFPGYDPVTPEHATRFSEAWGVPVPGEVGLRLTEMVEAMARGEVRAMIVSGENPLVTEANSAHTREAFDHLDFLAVMNIFHNETSEIADVVLPASCFAEKDGTFTNSERRVQRVRHACDAPGEARGDWEVFAELGRRVRQRLGEDPAPFGYGSAEEIWDEFRSLAPKLAGITWERLEGGGIQWPCPDGEHPGSSLLFGDAFPRGKARFMVAEYTEPGLEMPDAEWPLVLNTGRVLSHWHGGDMTRRVEGLVELYPEVTVDLHAADAVQAGVGDGEMVRVVSRRGAIEARARVGDRVQPGSVFIPFVQLQGTAANFLTNNVFDPRSRIPEYKLCAVRIERIPGEGANGAR